MQFQTMGEKASTVLRQPILKNANISQSSKMRFTAAAAYACYAGNTCSHHQLEQI
jgi:hypothetical protein